MLYCITQYSEESVEYPTIRFKRPTVYDISEWTVTAIQQINAGIMSKESAIAYTMGYDEVEVQEELNRINNQEKDAYAKYSANQNFLDNNEENEDEHTTE